MPTVLQIPSSSGIYKITDLPSNNFYIGSSVNLRRRKNVHFSQLLNNKHYNVYLQRVYNKHGKHNLVFEVLELCEKVNLIEREQYYINTLNPEYNIAREAGHTLGYRHTEEDKLRMSEKKNGVRHSDARKLRQVGKKLSEEHKSKISASLMGKRKGIYGYKHTDTAKANMAISQLGNKNCVGYKHTEETKLKMSLAHRGKCQAGKELEEVINAYSRSTTP